MPVLPLIEFLNVVSMPVYLVGGAVRDLLLGRIPHDIDLVVEGDPGETAAAIARAVGGSWHCPGKGIARVIAPGGAVIDITRLAGSIEDDLRRRDYTVNAMAMALPSGDIIDPCGGADDLRRRRVGLISPTALRRDPVRLLRGPRLAVELGFSLEDATAQAIAAHAGLLRKAAPERVGAELLRLLCLPGGGTAMATLHRLGLLGIIFPELQEAEGVMQPLPHRLDVLGHLLMTVAFLDLLLAPTPPSGEGERLHRQLWEGAGEAGREALRLLDQELAPGRPRRALLKLAGLLHDVAKPRVGAEEGGRLRFPGHDRVGAEMAREMLLRLRLSRREVEYVAALVRRHMLPVHVATGGAALSGRTALRLRREMGESALHLAPLFAADTLATGGCEDIQHWGRCVAICHRLLSLLAAPQVTSPPRLISGHDVMQALGIGPGPMVGRALAAVAEAQAAGEVASREEALELVLRLGCQGA